MIKLKIFLYAIMLSFCTISCVPTDLILKEQHVAGDSGQGENISTALTITPIHPSVTLPLWDVGKVPLAKGTNSWDIPDITPYIPKTHMHDLTAVVIFPGGGYSTLADIHEGKDYAQFFNLHGIAAFVVHYRLGSHSYRHPAMLYDAARAVRYVRANSENYGINPHKIGVMGSSAGGHLAATILTKFDNGRSNAVDPVERVSSRPDFGILCYPVITMKTGVTHQGTCDNLLGKHSTEDQKKDLSAELHITSQTPKCFIWHTSTDTAVPVENSLLFASALGKNKIPFALYILQNGEHGQGLKSSFPYTESLPWANALVYWMKENKLIK